MKVTAITAQQKNPQRVNVMVDGKYRLSLDLAQVVSLGVKVGNEYSEAELASLESESQFGKLYMRALEYCLMRPRSSREVRDYLWRKTRVSKYKSRTTGEIKERDGVPPELTNRVYDRLVEKGYIDDDKFARYWIENRNLTKGSSARKLSAELQAKGVASELIATHLQSSERDDASEIRKIIAKKQKKYPDRQKFMQYLMRQGFRYDDIRRALDDD